MREPIVLESNQNHATITDNGICPTFPAAMGCGEGIFRWWLLKMKQAYGVVTKGNGDAWVIPEKHMSLSAGGGQAGQGYPAVLIAMENEDKSNDTDRENVFRMA